MALANAFIVDVDVGLQYDRPHRLLGEVLVDEGQRDIDAAIGQLHALALNVHLQR